MAPKHAQNGIMRPNRAQILTSSAPHPICQENTTLLAPFPFIKKTFPVFPIPRGAAAAPSITQALVRIATRFFVSVPLFLPPPLMKKSPCKSVRPASAISRAGRVGRALHHQTLLFRSSTFLSLIWFTASFAWGPLVITKPGLLQIPLAVDDYSSLCVHNPMAFLDFPPLVFPALDHVFLFVFSPQSLKE